MPFEKGHKKMGGREKGVQNKTTTENRERIQCVLDALNETILDDLAQLPPSERVKYYAIFSEFVTPKLQRTVVQNQEETPNRFQLVITSKPLRDGD